ncbi:hypothetical protein [Nocardioides taihuensis]|uniref:Exo-alpha-sialidase n=1 Tax=Nocardioides taihuensis TaxID=1835606 RepID=A0ABW0BFB2_9ACTN
MESSAAAPADLLSRSLGTWTETWSEPVTISDPADVGENVAIDGSGAGVVVTWSPRYANLLARIYRPGSGWSDIIDTPQTSNSLLYVHAAMAPDGQVCLSYEEDRYAGNVLCDAGDGVFGEEFSQDHPISVGVSSTGVFTAAWWDANNAGERQVYVSQRHSGAGQTWSEPLQLNTTGHETGIRPQVVPGNAAQASVTWPDRLASGTGASQVVVRSQRPDGTWTDQVPVAPAGMRDVVSALRPNGDLVVAYRQPHDGPLDVRERDGMTWGDPVRVRDVSRQVDQRTELTLAAGGREVTALAWEADLHATPKYRPFIKATIGRNGDFTRPVSLSEGWDYSWLQQIVVTGKGKVDSAWWSDGRRGDSWFGGYHARAWTARRGWSRVTAINGDNTEGWSVVFPALAIGPSSKAWYAYVAGRRDTVRVSHTRGTG